MFSHEHFSHTMAQLLQQLLTRMIQVSNSYRLESTVALMVTSCLSFTDNFVLHDFGTSRFLRTYADSTIQIHAQSLDNCQHQFVLSSTGSHVTITPDGMSKSIRLYITDATGQKLYFKVNITGTVSLECQDVFDNVSSLAELVMVVTL